jgi:hypothetical protein
VDSHNSVTLTSITLDGVDVSAQVGTIDSDSFVVSAGGLSQGSHTLTFTAVDTVGNTLLTTAQSYTFEVVARRAYSVPLSPGWNLVSLPGDPVDPSIDSVLPPSHPATQVLTFDPSDPNGPWLVATRAADGTWTGTLSSMVAGHAYWINTGAFTPMTSLIPERDPAAVLPTVSVVAGWNLVPIIDLQQTVAPTQANLATRGGALAALVPLTANPGFNAATYFASIAWSVAYGFDTQANQWRKITAIAGDFIGQGKGYWVWATRDGTLVP